MRTLAQILTCVCVSSKFWCAGFIAGERANALSKMQPDAAVQKFLDQLDEMFGSSQQPRPASSAYVKAHIFDWAQEPFVGGAYSYPSLGAQDGDREALAAPVAGTIFFAGEVGDDNCKGDVVCTGAQGVGCAGLGCCRSVCEGMLIAVLWCTHAVLRKVMI